jgi:hypothetical protein
MTDEELEEFDKQFQERGLELAHLAYEGSFSEIFWHLSTFFEAFAAEADRPKRECRDMKRAAKTLKNLAKQFAGFQCDPEPDWDATMMQIAIAQAQKHPTQ